MREMRDDLRLCHRVREMVVTAIGIEETPFVVHALAFDDSFHISLCLHTINAGNLYGVIFIFDSLIDVRVNGPFLFLDGDEFGVCFFVFGKSS